MGGKTTNNEATSSKKTIPVLKKSIRKKRRYHAGTRALLDIRRYQKTTKLLMRKEPTKRAIRCFGPDRCFFQKSALVAIQQALEHYASQICKNAQRSACFNGRVEIKPGELRLMNKSFF